MFIKSVLAFLIGALLCMTAQILIDKTKLTPARILVSFVVMGVLLGAVGIYDTLFDLAGCGVSLPLIGYGASIANGVREAVMKDGFWGILSGPLTASAIGLSLSLTLGFLMSLLSRGKPKNM